MWPSAADMESTLTRSRTSSCRDASSGRAAERDPGRELTLIAPVMVSLLMEQRRWAEAEPLALRVLAIRDSMADSTARASAEQLAELYKGWAKADKEAEYRTRAGGR
jgi:hypothetical protein